MTPVRAPLPDVAREARGLKLHEARGLVALARKNADLEALAGLCRDRRVAIRKDAAYALIAFLVHDAAADRDRLATWWTTRMETPEATGRRGVSSDDVPRDLPDLYERARSTFLKALSDKGVREPERVWRKREHAFKVGLHMRASGIMDARRRARETTT